jgi:hypothetical protein
MNPYGLWVVLGIFELLGIFAVTNPSALVEWMTPQIKPRQYPEIKPIVKFIGWVFIIPPTADLGGFLFWPKALESFRTPGSSRIITINFSKPPTTEARS